MKLSNNSKNIYNMYIYGNYINMVIMKLGDENQQMHIIIGSNKNTKMANSTREVRLGEYMESANADGADVGEESTAILSLL